MEEIVISFTRKWTDLGDLQKGKNITYTLFVDMVKHSYHIAVTCGEKQEIVRHICAQETGARNLLCFLYENAVDLNHLYDILHDLKMQGKLPII